MLIGEQLLRRIYLNTLIMRENSYFCYCDVSGFAGSSANLKIRHFLTEFGGILRLSGLDPPICLLVTPQHETK